MKCRELFLWGLWGFFLLSETVDANSYQEHTFLSDSNERDFYEASNKFKCPTLFGTYADPEDCSLYYVCMSGIGIRRKCRTFFRFDVFRKSCLPIGIAICEDDKESTKTTPSDTTVSSGTTSEDDTFVCPSFTGNFPHPNDCSKYYSCFLYVSTVKTCPKSKLFDAIKKECKPEKNVHCGDRQNPGITTTPLPTETTTQSIISETSTETITETISTITDSTTQTATSEDVITTTSFPTGPPEHDCDDEDEDCIITETGDPEDWFKCPQDMGAFPHPSSERLFIFCMNWIPSVKKCGLDRVFSKEMSTCINVE